MQRKWHRDCFHNQPVQYQDETHLFPQIKESLDNLNNSTNDKFTPIVNDDRKAYMIEKEMEDKWKQRQKENEKPRY